jgi:hypothetical protein
MAMHPRLRKRRSPHVHAICASLIRRPDRQPITDRAEVARREGVRAALYGEIAPWLPASIVLHVALAI